MSIPDCSTSSLEVLSNPVLTNNDLQQRRICVIGAGPGGLSLAHFLQKNGYNNVHVYEKHHVVGGKATGVWCESRQQYIGSGQYMINTAYSEMIALSKEFEVDLFGDKLAIVHFDVQSKTFMNGTDQLVNKFRTILSTNSNDILGNALESVVAKTFAKAIYIVVTNPVFTTIRNAVISFRNQPSSPTSSTMSNDLMCEPKALRKPIFSAAFAPLFQLSTAAHDIFRIYYGKIHTLDEHGFTELNEEVCETVDDFLENENVSRIAKHILKYIWDLSQAPAGYLSSGFSVPVVFRLKLSKIAPIGGWHCVMPDGYFNLSKAIAQKISMTEGSAVYTGRAIESIRRNKGGRGIEITTSEGGEIDYDDLIITGHLSDVVPLMIDASREEIQLSQEIATVDYVVTVAVVSGLPQNPTFYIPAHWEPAATGHVFLINKTQYDDSCSSNLYSIFQYGTNYDTGEIISDEKLLEIMKEDIKNMGGTISSIEGKHHWDYFPHPRVSALKNEFYQRLDKLQGHRNTFYAGSTLNFELTEATVRYSKYIVQKQFPTLRQDDIQVKSPLQSKKEDIVWNSCSRENTRRKIEDEETLHCAKLVSLFPLTTRISRQLKSMSLLIAAITGIVAVRSLKK